MICAVLFCTFFMESCRTVQTPKFTNVERLCKVQPGQSYETVVQTLGCDPYNILSNQADGYAIYLYKYKLAEREISAGDAEVFNRAGGETTGINVYNPKMQEVILVFKNGQLESLISMDGISNSPTVVMLNNTLYKISKDKDEYILVPTDLDIKDCKKDNSIIIGKKSR